MDLCMRNTPVCARLLPGFRWNKRWPCEFPKLLKNWIVEKLKFANYQVVELLGSLPTESLQVYSRKPPETEKEIFARQVGSAQNIARESPLCTVVLASYCITTRRCRRPHPEKRGSRRHCFVPSRLPNFAWILPARGVLCDPLAAEFVFCIYNIRIHSWCNKSSRPIRQSLIMVAKHFSKGQRKQLTSSMVSLHADLTVLLLHDVCFRLLCLFGFNPCFVLLNQYCIICTARGDNA